MPITVTAHSPAELLVMVPAIAGFTPRNSVVMVMFRGRFTGGAFRYGLPDPDSPPIDLKRHATAVMGTLCKVPGVTAVVPVILTDDPAPDDLTPPHAALAAVIIRRLQHAGFELRDALWQSGDGWGTYLPSRLIGRQSLDDLTRAKQAMAERVPAAAFDVDDQEVPDWIPAAAPKLVRHIRREGERLTPEMIPGPGDHPDQAMHLVNTLEDFLSFDEQRLRREAPRFLLAFSRPNVRDIALVQWACDLHTGLRETVRAQNWDGVIRPTDLDRTNTLLGQGRRPDPRRLRAAISALMVLVPLAEDRFRLGPLTMIGWLHWALGHGTRAHQLIDQARRIDPNYGMAELLDTWFSSGALPDWAFGEPEELAAHRPTLEPCPGTEAPAAG